MTLPDGIALFLAGLALYLNWRTERKVEKRDLMKERNDLLDTALKTKLTLQNMKLQLRIVPFHYRSGSPPAGFEDSTAQYETSIQQKIDEVDSYREQLKQGPLTAKLIDELSNQIREYQLYFEDFAPKVQDSVEGMIEVAKMTTRLRESRE